MKWKLPLFKTYSDKEDIKAVTKIIKRGTSWAVGPEIAEFEEKLAKYVGTKYALTFNSGTSALHILLLAHNIKDKEVIVPSFTFVATASAVVLAGGKPVFAESEYTTFGLDILDVKKKITPKTKAIIQLHYGGFPAQDTIDLRELADKHNIIFIEDAAESLGATINGKKVGSFGHSAIFSFCQNKVISTGEGGAIVTNSDEIYEKAKLLRSHGRLETAQDYFSSIGNNDYIEAGYNFRMSTMLAALGLSQLNKIEKIIKKRRELGAYLSKHLQKIGKILIPREIEGTMSVYQMYTLKLASFKLTERDDLQSYLAKKGIMSKVYFNPIHLLTLFKKYGYKPGDLPNTEALSKIVLNIPFFPHMTKKESDYIIGCIKQYFEGDSNEKS